LVCCSGRGSRNDRGSERAEAIEAAEKCTEKNSPKIHHRASRDSGATFAVLV
jgi:hypothetical protein